jgi:hypothetical protein
MAASWSGLIAQLEAAIETTWSDTKPPRGGGNWEADKIEREDFDRVHSDRGALKAPYAVIEFGEAQPAPGAPITAKVYELPVVLHYFARVEASSDGDARVRLQLEAMEDYLLPGSALTTAYPVMGCDGFLMGPAHPANERFLAADLPWAAGAITFRVWIGDS